VPHLFYTNSLCYDSTYIHTYEYEVAHHNIRTQSSRVCGVTTHTYGVRFCQSVLVITDACLGCGQPRSHKTINYNKPYTYTK